MICTLDIRGRTCMELARASNIECPTRKSTHSGTRIRIQNTAVAAKLQRLYPVTRAVGCSRSLCRCRRPSWKLLDWADFAATFFAGFASRGYPFRISLFRRKHDTNQFFFCGELLSHLETIAVPNPKVRIGDGQCCIARERCGLVGCAHADVDHAGVSLVIHSTDPCPVNRCGPTHPTANVSGYM